MTELDDLREDLDRAREELRERESAPLYTITDEDKYQLGLMKLQQRIRSLEEEERRLGGDCPCGGGDECVC